MAEITSLRDTISEKTLAEYKQLYPESFINSVLKGCTWLATHNNITYQTSIAARGNNLLFQETVDYLQIRLLDKDNISSGTKTEYDILSVTEIKDSSSSGTVFQVKTKYKTTSGLTLTLTPFLYYDPNAENPETYTQFQIDDKVNTLQAQIKELSNNHDGVLKNLTNEQLAAINSTATKDKIDSIVSKDDVYTKSEVDEKISDIDISGIDINLINYATKKEVTDSLKLKADVTVVDDIVNQEETKIKALLSNIYTKEEVNSKLLQKVDTTTLTASYTNNSDLKKQLLEKLDKTEVDTLIKTQNERFQQLTDDVLATEAKIEKNYNDLIVTVNNVKNEIVQDIENIKTTSTDTATEINNKITNLTNTMVQSSNELTKKITDLSNTVADNKTEYTNKNQEHDTIINKFQNLISQTASETNKLVDKNYVDDLVKNNAANSISADVDGNSFASKNDLIAGPWYSMGNSVTPSKNDYAIVKSDVNYNGNDVRYNYDGSNWIFFQEFKSGNSFTLTTNQELAVNSGITAEKVTKISTNETNIKLETQEREKQDTALDNKITAEATERLKKDNEILQKISTEETTRLEKDTEILAKLSTEETNRLNSVLQLTNKIGEVEKAYVLADDAIKKLISDSGLDLGEKVGSLTTLNTEVKTSIVDSINNVHDELHNTRVSKEGDTITGTLKIQLPGSSSFLSMEAGGKGVTFNIDANLGNMSILPVSAPDAGFELSGTSFNPRTNTLEYSLGSNVNSWNNIWVTNINGTVVTDFITKTYIKTLEDKITELETKSATSLTYNIKEDGTITYTQDEYDALSETEKNNGKIYIIAG